MHQLQVGFKPSILNNFVGMAILVYSDTAISEISPRYPYIFELKPHASI
jgi:hypothetical protein